jgi:hypothetical protein
MVFTSLGPYSGLHTSSCRFAANDELLVDDS